MKLENSNLEIIKLTQSFICHHLANKPHYWLDFALWRLGHPFSDLLRKVGLLTKDRMLSIYKNDFTTFTQPKNPFVIFKKPGADNAEDLIYTDKKSICNRDFLRSSDLTTPWSVSFVRRKPLQCHLKLVYTSLSRQLRPVSLCKRTLDTGHNDSKIFWSKSLHFIFRSTKLFFPQVCGLCALMICCNFKSYTF